MPRLELLLSMSSSEQLAAGDTDLGGTEEQIVRGVRPPGPINRRTGG